MQNDVIKELGTNFIEYAVAVNTDRAIPDAKSGLKPVARRILWSTFENGRLFSKPHVKAAKIVGDVMGEYHPHGDSSIYGALVRLSQDWVMRYPLIDWHGNNGNIIGDGAAHMRYTEARLSKLSEDGLLNNIKKRNVDFQPNYSEDSEEPITLPATFPNLLCNPNTGIGVAMACNWLPHNLIEVAQAIYDYMDGKEPMLPGPDFPTGGIIINKNDIPTIMSTGHGSVKVRGKYRVEKNNLIFYEIPYGTTIEALLTEIGLACDSKEIEGISEIRDESNKKGLRVVIECEKDVNPDFVAKKLFEKTDLQTSISYNQIALIDKTPTELNLKDCIKVYIDHNINCLIKEANFDLQKIENRIEILEGLLRALEDIDNIIALIKKSQSSSAAKDNLITKYKFTEAQAKAIVDMKLGKLAGLEKIELNNEYKDLLGERESLKNLLSSPSLQMAEIRGRLASLVKKYGDARRTELTQIDIKPEDKEIVAVVPEDVVVIMTKNGEVKKIPAKSFKVQRKNGKGIKNVDDSILDTISTNTIDSLMLFTNMGKMYKILVDNIPTGTNVSKGTSIYNLIPMEQGEKVQAINSLYRKTNAEYVVFITKNGLIKKTVLDEYTKIKKNTGIIATNIKDNDALTNVMFLKDEDIILITKQGMSIHFSSTEVNATGRATSGVKAIKLADNDEVLLSLPIHNKEDKLAFFTKKGFARKTSLDDFPYQNRGGKGVIAYKASALTGELVDAAMIDKEDNILLFGTPNSICISSTDIPELGRSTMGNIVMKNSTINSIAKL